MDEGKDGQKRYQNLVDQTTPNSKIFSNCLKAFVVGGIICVMGQGITNYAMHLGFTKDESAIITSILLILLSAVLTGLGLYSKFGKFSGAGTVVPITGFANSVVSPAIEFKKEASVIIGTSKRNP